MTKKLYTSLRNTTSNYANFQDSLPRSINGTPYVSQEGQGTTKTASPAVNMGDLATLGAMSGGNVYRNPSRRFYDPEVTTTAIYLPRTLKQKNRWRRWFFDHDEFIGAILELHSELPYSRAEIICEDKSIKRHIEECLDRTKLFSKLPQLDLEYLKIGEVFINTPWDNSQGMWSHIIPHNPDFVEVSASPFAEDNYVIELIPDDQLKAIINSTKPHDQQLKRRLPADVIRRVTSGQNLLLDPDEVTHIARKSNPYDLRGTSILDRIFRCYVPGTPVRLPNGTLKNIEQMQPKDTVISKHGEVQSVVGLVEYDVNTTLVKLRANKARIDLISTEGHEYLIRRQMCACGCGNRLSTKQIKRGSAYIGRHLLRDLNKYGTDKSTFSSEKKYEIIKIAATDIQEFDYLLIPISKDIIPHPDSLNLDRARLLGYYLAEGCHVNEGQEEKYPTINWTFCADELDTWVKDVVEILQKEFSIAAAVNKDGKNALSVQINRREDYNKFSSFIRTFISGSYSYDKKLSDDFMKYSPEIQEQLLIGEFRGDGWYQWDSLTECRACTVSKELAEQLEWLLIRCGYYSYITKTEAKEAVLICGKICKSRDAYHVNIAGGTFAREFVNKCWGVDIDLTHPENAVFSRISELNSLGKTTGDIARTLNAEGFIGCEGGKFYNETVAKALKNNGYAISTYQYDKNFIDKDENYFYVPIVVKEYLPYTGKVYDIEVTNEHWWLADKFVTSNTLMYEDKLREAQITIADNFIYPLKIFKLGDPQNGWIPNASHQAALAQMLQQATLDPNFALIYHYGLQVDYVTVADKVMRLDPEWTEINNKKAIALGVSQQFITGETTYASANVGLQTQLARYKAKRDLFEINWIKNKFFKVMAERNEWYKRDKKELVGQYRVARKGIELAERLIMPKLVWHKKLMMRDDQSFLTFMSNIYANGKGPLSTVTMLQAMGLELEDELGRKKTQEELEDRIGAFVHPPSTSGGGGGGLLPSLANFKNKFIKKANTNIDILTDSANHDSLIDTDFFTKHGDTNVKFVSKNEQEEQEKKSSFSTYNYIKSSLIDEERSLKLNSHRLDPLFVSLLKKAQDLSFSNDKELNLIIRKVYGLGKNYAYTKTGFIPYTNFKVAGLLGNEDNLDYSDVVNIRKFEEWLSTIFNDSDAEIIDLISLLLSVYCHGQITGYEEQGIFNVRLTNVPGREGLCFKSNDLLKNGINLGGLLSTDLDVPLFDPFINGITNVDVAEGVFNLNTPDPQVEPYKTLYVLDTEVSNCPIELIEESEELYNKIHTILQNEGISQIKYVDEVVDSPEWEENEVLQIKLALDKEEKDLAKKAKLDPMTRNLLISSKLKTKKDLGRGCLFFAKVNSCLLVSNGVLKNKKSLTAQLFKDLNLLESPKNKSLINSRFALNHNLNSEEIKVSLLYNCISPIYDESRKVVGYKVNDDIAHAGSMNPKLIKQGLWDAEGNILETKKISPLSVFLENIENYVNYPYKVDDNLKLCYGSLNGRIQKT